MKGAGLREALKLLKSAVFPLVVAGVGQGGVTGIGGAGRYQFDEPKADQFGALRGAHKGGDRPLPPLRKALKPKIATVGCVDSGVCHGRTMALTRDER